MGNESEEACGGVITIDLGRFIGDEESSQCRTSSRPNKGCTSDELPKNYVVIDLETTGRSPQCDEIIEFAALKVVEGEVVGQFQELARPSFPIPTFITHITNISNEMVKDARPSYEVYEDFIKFIGNEILVGHNVNFDINFLYDYGTPNTIISNDYVDTLSIARTLLPGLACHKLGFLCDTLKLSAGEGYHRALFDCIQTNKLYQHFLEGVTEEEWIALREAKKAKRKRYSFHNLDLKSIHATVAQEDIDKTNPFYGKNVAFTGSLERFERKDAAQIVINLGGVPQASVTKKTDFLVLGNNDYCKTIKDPSHKSSKQLKAEKMIEDGCGIQILPEDVFYEMLEE